MRRAPTPLVPTSGHAARVPRRRLSRHLRGAMTEHIVDLANEAGVQLSWIPKGRSRWEAQSYPTCEPPVALVPTIQCGLDYLVALHEVGHCASPESVLWADERGPYAHVLCEGAAWAWAMERADAGLLEAVTARDWAEVAAALGSHLRAAALSQEGSYGPVRH